MYSINCTNRQLPATYIILADTMNSPNIFGAFIKSVCKFIPPRRVRLAPCNIIRQTPLAHGLSLEHVISGMPEQEEAEAEPKPLHDIAVSTSCR